MSKSKATLGAAGILFAGLSFTRHVCAKGTYRELELKGVKAIEVKTAAADVEVDAFAGPQAIAELRSSRPIPEGCVLRADVADGRLVLNLQGKPASKRHFWGRRNSEACSGVTLALKLPEGFALSVNTASGEVRAKSRKGALEINTASGDIELKGRFGRLGLHSASGDISGVAAAESVDAATLSGDVDLKGLAGPVQAQTASGDIGLAWLQPPAVGEIAVESASGDIVLYLPKETSVNAELSGAFGSDPINELGSNPQARLKLQAVSASGSVALKKKAG